MNTIKEVLHEKRKTTEDHIRQLQWDGKQGVRYTAMMPDMPFLVLELLPASGNSAVCRKEEKFVQIA